MPKLKKIRVDHQGSTYEAPLSVSSSGEFSIIRPGTQEDWPDADMKIFGSVASVVEDTWKKAVREFIERTKTERRVLAVRFDSSLREDGKKDFFTDGDAMLFLKCAIAIEVTTKQGGETNSVFREPPEFQGLHSPRQPFPPLMTMEAQEIKHHRDSCTVVEWTQEMQDMLIRACRGIESIVEMLDKVTATPESLRLHSTTDLKLLGAPEKKKKA